MRRLVVVAGLAAALMAVAPGTVSANVLWCLSDPPQSVSTPGGNNLTVSTTLYAPAAYRHDLSNVTETISMASDGNGGTLITEDVFVPASISQLTAVVTVKRYSGSASGSGPGGSEIVLTLDVPAA